LATVWEVDPGTGTATVAEDDFTNIIDLDFTSDGDLLVLQLTSIGLASSSGPGPGRLIRIDSITGARQTLMDDPLFFRAACSSGPTTPSTFRTSE
jgi:hypothetical protein